MKHWLAMLSGFVSRHCGRAAALVVLVLTGCSLPVEFTVPLADPGEFEIDTRLVGTWYGVSRCSEADRGDFQPCQQSTGRPALLTTLQISVKPGNNELLVRGSALPLDASDFEPRDRDFAAARVLHFEATAIPARIDGTTYYSVRRHAGVGYDYTAANEEPYYMIAQAELADADTLNLRVLLLNAPVQIGRFGVARKVEVPNSRYFDYAVVAAPRERLIALLRETDGEGLFPWTFGPFRRVTAAFETAGLETQACEPQSERLNPRLDALANVAIELARLGLSEHALESARLALAMDAAGARRVSSLGTVAEAQALAGDLEGARATLDRVRRKSPLASLFDSVKFVRPMALVGWIPDALALAEAQEFPCLRTEALTEIAVIQAANGDRAAAMQTVRLAGSVSAAIRVAEEFAQKGDGKGARDVLVDAAALSRENRADLLSIARRQLEWGQVDALRNTVRMAASANAATHELADRETALQQLELAELQAELKDLAGARESLEPMFKLINKASSQERQDDRVFRYLPLDRVIALQVRLSDRPGARQTLQQVIAYYAPTRRDVSEYDAASAIVRAYTAIGDLSEAMELAKKHGANLLYEIADTQRRVGDTAGQRLTLKVAFQERRAEIERDRGRLAREWGLESDPISKALIHARAGDPDAAAYFFALAVDDARHVRPLWAQVDRLLCVAEDQMKTGDVGGARTSGIYAFALAKDLPTLAPCRGLLLNLLFLPELKPEGKE